MPHIRSILAFLIPFLIGQPSYMVAAEDFPIAETASPVATINQDRLFSDSLYGKTFSEKFQADASNLAEENRRIEQELIDEENALTEKRKELSNVEFRKLASEFNAKVEKIRTEQAAKTNELNATRIQARRAFYRLAQPHIIQLMQERGIQFILSDQAIFISASDGDITDAAIERINQSVSASESSQEQ